MGRELPGKEKKLETSRKLGKLFLGALLACFLMFLVTGCGEEYTVTIQDMGQTMEVTAKSGQKIKTVLEDAGITLGEQDETDPALDEKISGETEITVKRFAAVTVIGTDGAEYPVERVGGTVADAIEAAGITLGEGQTPDVESTEYLTDGMTITIVQATAVNLTTGGKTNTVYTNADTVEAFLAEQQINLGENDRVMPEATAAIAEGMEIKVQRVEIKEETVTEEIAYSTETQNSSSLASGKTETKQAGVKGSKDVTYRVTYVDGTEESREVISETVTKEPVNEIIVKGTKKSSSGSSSSNQTSGGKTVVSVEYYDDCDGSGHGIKVITYSDGTMEEVPY